MHNSPIDTCPVSLSDDDIFNAMKDIGGYLDITPGDFKTIYEYAVQHAYTRLSRSITAKEMMIQNVVSVSPDDSLTDVADILNRNDISGVPVVESDRKVVGIVSEKDFLFKLGHHEARSFMGVVVECLKSSNCIALSIRKQTAGDLMTSPAIIVTEETRISDIASLLSEKQIRRVPVIDANGILKGIVTRSDLIQSFCSIDA